MVVAAGVGSFEHPGKPEENFIGNLREFPRKFFTEKSYLIRSKRGVPEKKPVRFKLGDPLGQGGLENVENLVKIRRRRETLPYFFGRIGTHGLQDSGPHASRDFAGPRSPADRPGTGGMEHTAAVAVNLTILWLKINQSGAAGVRGVRTQVGFCRNENYCLFCLQ